MRIIKSILLLLFFCNFLNAQSGLPIPNWHFIDQSLIPRPIDNMPEHIQMLYAEEVNMILLEKSFNAYYDQHGWNEFKEDLERNPFAKFFHYWHRGASDYVDDNGIVRVMNTDELLQHRNKIKSISPPEQGQPDGPTSTWSFLGPKRTLWRKEHADPQYTAPWQVNIYCIDISLSNPSILYCGSETGAVYKTIDKGLNWTPFNDFNFGRAILSIAIHPTNPDIVLAATSSDILRTTNGGSTWTIVETQSGLNCNSMAFSPTNPSTIFAGTGNGLYVSTDTGVTWTQKLTEEIFDVKFRPNDGTTIYVLSGDSGGASFSFYKSTDSGSIFNLNMTGFGSHSEHSGGKISVTPADADYIYAILLTHDGTGNNTAATMLKTTDAATNWTALPDCTSGTGQGYYDLSIQASHVNAEHLLAGTQSIYKSTDGGATWFGIGGYTGNFGVHPDLQAMATIVDGPTENTWMATDGGTNFSTDFYTDLVNWEARIDGLDGTDFWGFAQGWNEDYIVGGRYHNGNTAIHENYPDKQALRMGGAESPTGWAMHGRERYAAFDDISETIIPDQIDEVAEGTFLFTKHPNIYYYGDAFGKVMVDLEDFMTIYTTEGNSFWKSIDGGASWEATHTFSGKPFHFDISRADGNYIYLTSDDGFFKSTDRGETFSTVTIPSEYTNWHMQNIRVAASATNKDEVWILNQRSGATSTTGRVYKSSNGGSTWTNWTTANLSGRKWSAIAHQAGTDGGIYIASKRGDTGINPSKIMYRDNTMSDWVDFSNGFPHSANVIKLLPFYRDEKLRWGGNRGAWEVDFYEENWTPIVQPFVSGKTQICDRDTVEFDSYSVASSSATYAWSIPGASWTSINLNQREVQALFPSAGTYTATLTITQDAVPYTKSVEVTIEADCNAETDAGNAISLSGASSDYGATNDALNISTNTLTLSAWIKRDGTQNDYSGIVFSRNTSSIGLNFRPGNQLAFHWDNSQWWWDSGLIVPDNEWAHVAMVVTPTETTLYLNGVPSVNTADPAIVNIDGAINFGADPNWSARRFKGEMDEVIIYNRSLTEIEIRELMHLTRDPATETDMIGYWQFNRNSGTITDRVGNNHASLIGGAARVTSTAPIGSGESARMNVTSEGNYSFGTTGVTLEFPTTGTTFPNGELCVTKIDNAPDQSPFTQVSPSYWIIHNYGTNSTFDELTSMTFDGIGEVTAAQTTDPSQLKLYKRNSGDCGNTWGTSVDYADAATAGSNGSVTFSTDNGQTSFSQFIVSFESSVLPVNLINFDANINREKQVELNWSSASEEEFSFYEIQRSKDGNTFEALEKVPTQGNGIALRIYSALDKNPLRGQSYYRLKMVDNDGSFEYSNTVSILFDALADKVILYPNPLSQGQKLIIKTEFDIPIEIRFYSSDGEEVGEYNVQGDTELTLPDLPKGVYGYTMQTATWKKSGMLIIQ